VKENPNGPTGLYGIDQFTYVPEQNSYICPEGKPLKYVGIHPRDNAHLYYSTPKRCRECSQKSRCTRGKYRIIKIHTCEPARQRARARAETPEFAISQRARRKVETTPCSTSVRQEPCVYRRYILNCDLTCREQSVIHCLLDFQRR
jgi:hypothetical protein